MGIDKLSGDLLGLVSLVIIVSRRFCRDTKQRPCYNSSKTEKRVKVPLNPTSTSRKLNEHGSVEFLVKKRLTELIRNSDATVDCHLCDRVLICIVTMTINRKYLSLPSRASCLSHGNSQFIDDVIIPYSF